MGDSFPRPGGQAAGDGSLPLAKRIIGYCDPLSAAPGDEVRFFISCEPDITEFHADLVRMRAGAPGCEGKGPACAPVLASPAGTYPARTQEVHPGSYALVPGGERALADEEVTFVVLVQPTLKANGPQAVLSWGDPWEGTGFALILDEQLRPALAAGADAGNPLTCPAALEVGTWAVLVGTLRRLGPTRLSAAALGSGPQSWSTVTTGHPELGAGPVGTDAAVGGPGRDVSTQALRDTSLVFGAVRSTTGITRKHFTGRLESPMIFAGTVNAPEACALISAGPDQLGDDRVRAAWDFAIGIDSWEITDRGPRGLHGSLHNLPMRAVRGARWSGKANDWQQAPGEYAAIHFLADALEDCQWSSDFSWTVPVDTRSGFYAARITSGRHQDLIPFFVRPAAAAAEVLLIAPTATYAAYGNSRFWWENPIQELVQDRLVEIGAEEQYLITHPELGASSYDCHLDGTDVCYVSRLRPNLNMRPGHVRREGYTSDLDLVAWLDHLDLVYDVITDEDLHREGLGLLRPYPVVLTGTHPEYMSARMFDAISAWVTGGGRLIYMGGNGFSMNVNFDRERPWIMENRRVDLWERGEEVKRSEAVNSTDGLRGGYLASSGRQAASVTGVESAAMGFDHSYPYVLGDGARRAEAAFVFQGVSGDVIGDFGAIGGGVVGQEWDNAAAHEFGPEHLILASSHDHTFVPPMFGATRPDYHADLVLYLHGPGAVFSVSSMAWGAALSHQNYVNEIAQISSNVLRRFLEPAPFTAPGEVAGVADEA